MLTAVNCRFLPRCFNPRIIYQFLGNPVISIIFKNRSDMLYQRQNAVDIPKIIAVVESAIANGRPNKFVFMFEHRRCNAAERIIEYKLSAFTASHPAQMRNIRCGRNKLNYTEIIEPIEIHVLNSNGKNVVIESRIISHVCILRWKNLLNNIAAFSISDCDF